VLEAQEPRDLSERSMCEGDGLEGVDATVADVAREVIAPEAEVRADVEDGLAGPDGVRDQLKLRLRPTSRSYVPGLRDGLHVTVRVLVRHGVQQPFHQTPRRRISAHPQLTSLAREVADILPVKFLTEKNVAEQ